MRFNIGWINIFGLIIVIFMLIPNTIYACKNKNIENKCTNRPMNSLEQLGRYGAMFLMVFNIGISEFGAFTNSEFAIWAVSMAILIILYWVFWLFYFKAPQNRVAIVLAIIPSAIFILNGMLLRHWLLLAFGVAFSIGHIYVTHQNNQAK